MWPVTTQFLAALSRPHQLAVTVDSYLGDTHLGSVQIGAADSGEVRVSATSRIRRTLSLTLPETLYPASAADTLTPYGAELQVSRGIRFGDTDVTVPVFRGRIESVDDSALYDGRLEVHAVDRMAYVNSAEFEVPRVARVGVAIVDEISALILEAVPTASVVNLTGSADLVPSGLIWDRDRGKAVDELAVSIGAEVYATPDGAFVIRPVPTLDDATVWSLTDGVDGVVVADSRSVSREGVFNVVVVEADRPDGSLPLRVITADLDPASPTYVAGPFGRAPRFYSSPFVTTAEQAATAGVSLLARSIGLTRQRRITCVPNPALEVGDVLAVTVGGELEYHIADEISVPLTVSGAMTIETRSTRSSE